jgi:hypothetical protein
MAITIADLLAAGVRVFGWHCQFGQTKGIFVGDYTGKNKDWGWLFEDTITGILRHWVPINKLEVIEGGDVRKIDGEFYRIGKFSRCDRKRPLKAEYYLEPLLPAKLAEERQTEYQKPAPPVLWICRNAKQCDEEECKHKVIHEHTAQDRYLGCDRPCCYGGTCEPVKEGEKAPDKDAVLRLEEVEAQVKILIRRAHDSELAIEKLLEE